MKNKLTALLIHLIMSAIVVGLFLLFVTHVWYPAPYFEVSGLTPILLMLVMVDVILGPFLTFIVYKKGKKTLKFDLSVIVITQLCAFSYGVYTIYQTHPVYAVYSYDRIALVTAQTVAKKQAKFDQHFKVSSFGKPTLVYATLPSDPAKREAFVMENAFSGDDLEFHPEYYQPLTEFTEDILIESIPLKRIQKSAKANTLLNDFLKKTGKKATSLAFIPLVGIAKTMTWVIDRESKQPIGVLELDPLTELSST